MTIIYFKLHMIFCKWMRHEFNQAWLHTITSNCNICLPLFVSRHSIYYFWTETIDKDQNTYLFLNKCIVCLGFSLARWPLTSHSLSRAPSTVGDSLLPLSPNLLPMYLPTFKISPNLLHVYLLNMDWPPGKSFVLATSCHTAPYHMTTDL